MAEFELQTEEARLLLNLALMAVGNAKFTSAAKLLAVVESFRPDQPSVAEAKAVALFSSGQFQLTLDYLDGQAIPKFPDAPMLKVFKGLSLIRLGRKEDAKDAVRDAAYQTDNPAAANLAKEILNE